MMLFLIDYDRHEGKVVELREFQDSERQEAESVRLDLELTLNRQGIQREVVLLQAVDMDALRRTHRRYFENLGELASTSIAR